MSRKDIFAEAKEHAIAGRAPVIQVEAGHRVITPKRPPGRPRIHPEGTDHKGYRLCTPSGKRMRCRNPGCQKFLWKDADNIVCGELCREELAHRCRTMLEILEGKRDPAELDIYYRSRKASGGAA